MPDKQNTQTWKIFKRRLREYSQLLQVCTIYLVCSYGKQTFNYRYVGNMLKINARLL